MTQFVLSDTPVCLAKSVALELSHKSLRLGRTLPEAGICETPILSLDCRDAEAGDAWAGGKAWRVDRPGLA
jgi:hypothetical protein